MLLIDFIPNFLLEIRKAKLISRGLCLHNDATLDQCWPLLVCKACSLICPAERAQTRKLQFKMCMDSDKKYCSDWIWGKFVFTIRLHSLKLSTHKDDGLLPAWRNCCIIVTYELFEALMHGHHFTLCLINLFPSTLQTQVNYRKSLTQASTLRAGHLSTKIKKRKKLESIMCGNIHFKKYLIPFIYWHSIYL